MANRPLYIIDSDDASNTMLVDMLAPQGFDVSTFRTGKEGLAAIQTAPPALVLLCLELVDMSGYVICKKIKETDATADVPVIIMSRDATEKDFERHRKLKVAAQDYISKPFENSEMLRKVENIAGFNVSEETYDSLEAKLEGMFEQGTTDDELKLKQKEIDRLQKEMETLRAELLNAKKAASSGQDGALSAKLLAAETERDQLRRKVQELENAAVNSGKVTGLEQQIRQLAAERDEWKTKFDLRESSLKELNDFKLNAELELRQLQAQTGNVQGELESLRMQIEQRDQAVGELEARINDYQAELNKQFEDRQNLEERYKAELEQVREELTQAESESAENAARLEKRETDLLQEIEAVREQTEMMREDYERRLSETRDAARRVLEDGLAALDS